MELLNQCKGYDHTNCSPYKDCCFSNELNSKVMESATVEYTVFNVEQTIRQSTPDTVCKVNCNSTNRVINVELHIKELNNYYNNDT